jgi:hypothetical protein
VPPLFWAEAGATDSSAIPSSAADTTSLLDSELAYISSSPRIFFVFGNTNLPEARSLFNTCDCDNSGPGGKNATAAVRAHYAAKMIAALGP